MFIFSDQNSTITFNSRTKAVMADVVQDNVKEKVRIFDFLTGMVKSHFDLLVRIWQTLFVYP